MLELKKVPHRNKKYKKFKRKLERYKAWKSRTLFAEYYEVKK